MKPELQRGYARAREVARRHAKSFFFSSFLLWGERRRAAFALYAFCRRMDDLVDGPASLGSPGDSHPDPRRALDGARAWLRALHAGAQLPSWPGAPVPPEEQAAFAHTLERFALPLHPFLDLLDGMEMDLTKSRYARFSELDLYCYRVAGTVGLMMTPVLGYRDPAALEPAADLGRAMQLTNILRDVREDLARGRLYLPQDELGAFGVEEEDLQAGRLTPGVKALLRYQVARARGYYARAAKGIPLLEGAGARRMVRLMSAVYGGILDVIEARGHDVFTSRAHVPTRRKLQLAVQVLLQPSPRAPLLVPETAPATAESHP